MLKFIFVLFERFTITDCDLNLRDVIYGQRLIGMCQFFIPDQISFNYTTNSDDKLI